MLLDVCLGTKSAWRILLVLSEAPGKGIERKEIQELTGMGNKALTKFLQVLEKFNLIQVSKLGRSYIYKLNLSNPFTEQILEIIQLEKRQLNNPDFQVLSILREFVYELTNITLDNIEQVSLFGSYAKQTHHADSDIDVAIVVKGRQVDDELLITDVIDRLEKRFGKQIQPHYLTQEEFQRKDGSALIREIHRDGIRLL